MDRRRFLQIGSGALLVLSAPRYALAGADAAVKLRVLATTDIHSFLTDFDYYKDAPTDAFGLVRTASLIEQARAEAANSVLVDNGDLIQGNPIADYQAGAGHEEGRPHPAVAALNLLQYDVGTLGNHEFNYGLEYLDSAIKQADFPIINANIVKAGTDEPLYTPYVIQKKEVKDEKGSAHTINIGYIGFVPPQVMVWDKAHLQGNVEARDIVKTAEKYIPRMLQEGADVIIALAHTGPSDAPYEEGAENSAFYLAGVKGIDAVVFGHAHRLFPHKEFAASPNVNVEKGTVYNQPQSMAGYWGNHLSVIDLELSQTHGKWHVTDGRAALRPIYDGEKKAALADNHPVLAAMLKDVHDATRAFVAQPIGKSSADMYSYLALVQDDPTVQIVNRAQKAYVENLVQSLPELAGIPILSAGAPFKAGGRKNDPNGYTEVDQGELTFRNAADLYLYPNTLVVVKVSGAELREWLECSAGMFRQIDAQSSEPQALLDWEGFRTYNFDVIDGVQYRYDITQPARYDGECRLVNADARRVADLRHNGQAVKDDDIFLIATNNYRAYGNKFPGTGDDHIVYAAPDENRQILADYIRAQSDAHGHIDPQADKNWRFVPIAGAPDIRFETAPGDKARAFIAGHAQYPMEAVGVDEAGFAVYRIDLSARP